MAGPDFLAGLAHRLRAGGDQVDAVPWRGAHALVGYRSDFRMRWGATKLHLFTVAIHVPMATDATLTEFSADAVEYAVRQRGRARGLQIGVAAVALVVADYVETSAVRAANEHMVKRYAAFGWPALFDLGSGASFRHEGRVVIGGVYAKWMRERCDLALGRPV